VDVEQVEWPDACLGVQLRGQVCAEVLTPGYRVTLEVQGQQYVYHTDQAGSQALLAAEPGEPLENPPVAWQGKDDDGSCQVALIASQVVNYGACEGALAFGALAGEQRVRELDGFVARFAPFDAETPAGSIQLAGQGLVTATPAQQRMLAEWAQQVFQEARSGRTGAAWGLAIAYHIEGGLVGFCEDVYIHTTGEAYAVSCRNEQVGEIGRTRLVDSQLSELYRWLDGYQNFEMLSEGPYPPDALRVSLIFAGNGAAQVDQHEQAGMEALAMQVLTQLSTPANPDDLAMAEKALRGYLQALNREDYAGAVALFGGSYDLLVEANPSIPADDPLSLFTNACTINGYECDLEIRNIVSADQLNLNRFRFSLELQNPDGSLYALGPCCGGDPEDFPPHTQFEFYVVKLDDGRFLVEDLPVYGG
jgi:hypothetical protein